MKLRMWNTQITKEKTTPTNTYNIRPRLENAGKILKIQLVRNTGKNKSGYWLIKLDKKGLNLIGNIGTKPGFELTTGGHIRALIAKGTINKVENIEKEMDQTLITPPTTTTEIMPKLNTEIVKNIEL